MAIGTKLGGTELTEPAAGSDGFSVEIVGEGATLEMADGALVYDYSTSRNRYTLNWNNITGNQRDTILGKYNVKTAQAFSRPDTDTTSTVSVFVLPNTWRETSLVDSGNTTYYNISFSLEDAS